MEERSVWLEAELLTIKANNYELKTKLEAGTFDMKAENMELKSRLMQGKKQYVFFPKVFLRSCTLGSSRKDGEENSLLGG